MYAEYLETIENITTPQNGKDPIAYYGPISRACRSRVISFEDRTAAYFVDEFIPNN